VVALSASTHVAHAQPAAPPPPTLQQPSPDSQKPTSPSLPPSGDNLSEKLDRSNGVIAPPSGVDPGIAVAPKDPGAGSTMPVIPPPAGTNPSVRPQ
jgi:hypothetical protein